MNAKDISNLDIPYIIARLHIGDAVVTKEGRQGTVTEVYKDQDDKIIYTFKVASGDLWTCQEEDIYSLTSRIHIRNTTTSAICKHSWKNYIGLTETFTYCEHCDERQG